MRRAKKLGLIGAGVGFCLALLMSGFAYYIHSHHLAYDLSLLYLCLAPTSYVLVVTEWTKGSGDALIVLIFASSNALIYGFLFFIIGTIWDVISRRKRSEP